MPASIYITPYAKSIPYYPRLQILSHYFRKLCNNNFMTSQAHHLANIASRVDNLNIYYIQFYGTLHLLSVKQKSTFVGQTFLEGIPEADSSSEYLSTMATDYCQPGQSSTRSGAAQQSSSTQNTGQQADGRPNGNGLEGNGTISNVSNGNESSGHGSNGDSDSPSGTGGQTNGQSSSVQTLGSASLEEIRAMYPSHFDALNWRG